MIMPMVRFCVEVALYQISLGRKFIIENPETFRIWQTKEFRMLSMKNGVTWNVTDMCRHGMKDPFTKLPYKKGTCLMRNFLKDLSILCSYDVEPKQDTHMTSMKR